MKISNLKNIFKNNEYEIKTMKEKLRGYPKKEWMSIKNKISFLERQNSAINTFIENDSNKALSEKDNIKVLNRLSKGRVKTIFSNIIGQVDKKIHNSLNKNDKIWDIYQKNINEKYYSTSNFYLKRYMASLIPLVGGIMLSNVPIIGLGLLSYAKNIGGNIKTIYEKNKYGILKPIREYPIYRMSWIDNIKTSIYKYRKQKRLFSNKQNNELINSKQSKEQIIDEINNFDFRTKNIRYIENLIKDFSLIENPSTKLCDKYQEIVNYHNWLIQRNNTAVAENTKYLEEKFKTTEMPNTILKKEEKDVEKIIKQIDLDNKNPKTPKDNTIIETKKVDINNYANMDYLQAISYEKNPNQTMNFSEAISIIRDKKLHKEDEWRNAVSVLSSTFGSSRQKKNDTSKNLNDFNKTEKLLSIYGRKIKNNTATNEEKLIYNALIYHLAMCDLENFSLDDIKDYINDYIIEEADRYIEDVKKYQKIKL